MAETEYAQWAKETWDRGELPGMIISLSDVITLAPNLTIKPLAPDLHLVAQCDCQANVCHNTAACRRVIR